MRWREFCEDKIVDLREDLSFMDLYLILFVYAKKKNKKQKTKRTKLYLGIFWYLLRI